MRPMTDDSELEILNRRVITEIVTDSSALFALVEDGLRRVEAQPDDTFAVLSTFILMDSLRSWRQIEGHPALPAWPYAETVRELANGTKHLHLRAKNHPDPHVAGLAVKGDWGTLDWDDLDRDTDMISVHARRAADDVPHWKSALGVLHEAAGWWRDHLEQSSR